MAKSLTSDLIFVGLAQFERQNYFHGFYFN